MMQAKGIHLLSVLMMIALLYWTHAQPLDPVDECLFSCDYCFKGEVLLNCANECLLRDNGEMGSEWTTLCPVFGLLTFDKR